MAATTMVLFCQWYILEWTFKWIPITVKY